MKLENWQKVSEIVLDALEVNATRRQKFVEKRCADAPELRREVESLLSGEPAAERIFNSPAVISYASFFVRDEEPPEELAGQVIGNYRIVREIGRGGMGAVYLATRADGAFQQRVAIKMLKRELNNKDFRINFNREKEILARLSHPNIASLIDAGTTLDGVPYFVMEFIEGVPIDAFCRDNGLRLNQRLKLFNGVCEAVAFAHRNLIVHRDLKPSNILVTEDGKPKLLDFGISKLLGTHAAGDEQTITNLGAMTPQYASPEQIRGETVTTATDVYSLGIVLYKLLTEEFPYNFKSKTNETILKAITETEPVLPSRKIAAINSKQIKAITASQLKGDLDNIILKALSKAAERRYQTIEQFSSDIWRFIDGMPVLARPATFSYHARKFYERNKIPVLAAALVLISLCLGIAIAVSQANAARQQAQIASEASAAAELETKRARAEQEKAEKISRFMAKIISYANPRWDTDGAKAKGETKVIDVLIDLSARIDTEFPENTDVRAELHHKFAEVFYWITKPYYRNPRRAEARQKSKFHASRALALRREFYGERHELVAKDLAYIFWTHEQEPADAAKTLAEGIQMMRETNPKNSNMAFKLAEYAGNLMLPNHSETEYDVKYPREEYHETFLRAVIPPTNENKYQIGERYLREALPIMRAHFGQDTYAVFVTECYVAYSLAMQERWTDFDEPYRVCKQGEIRVRDENSLIGMRTVIGWVDRALAEKKLANYR